MGIENYNSKNKFNNENEFNDENNNLIYNILCQNFRICNGYNEDYYFETTKNIYNNNGFTCNIIKAFLYDLLFYITYHMPILLLLLFLIFIFFVLLLTIFPGIELMLIYIGLSDNNQVLLYTSITSLIIVSALIFGFLLLSVIVFFVIRNKKLILEKLEEINFSKKKTEIENLTSDITTKL